MVKINNHAPFRLFKRGNIWHAYISVRVNRQRIVIRESTGESETIAAQNYCLNRIKQLQSSPAATHEITLDSAAARWTTDVLQYQSYPESRLYALQIMLREMDSTRILSQITRTDITNFIDGCHAHGRKPSTINRYLCLLSAICTYAKTHLDCNVPPFRILSFRLKEPKENIKYFKDWTEVQTLVDAAAPHIRPIILTALYTGLRLGRILSLEWNQIDFDNNIIVYMGKDGNPHSVPLIPQLRDVLLSIPHEHTYVFTYKGKSIQSIKKSWKKAFEKSGLPYKNFHTLRHTTATWLLRNTGNLKLVQTVLGHSTINVTTKYAHLVNNESQTAMTATFSPDS